MGLEAVTKALGRVNQYNPLQTAQGALVRGKNGVCRRENIYEPRRGHALYATLANNISQYLTYRSRVLNHHGTVLSYDNGSGTYANYSGSYTAPTNYKMQFAEANQNLYITTSLGVKVLSDIAGTAARSAGVPRCLDPSYVLAGSTGFLANNFQCAYRAVIQKTDANSNVITGYPSQRLWVSNSAGAARNVTLTLYIPSETIAGDVVQFYRTAQVSGVSTDDAADEMQLVYQYTLTSTDITNGYMSFTDSVTDSLRGATLYTSPSQQGISQANERPPLCKDLGLYKDNFMFYANTSTKQRLYSTLVGTGTLGSATTGDTTNTSADITNVANTANLEIGWKVEGAGIPAGATITNIVGTTVTISAAATATAVGVSLSFYTHRTITLGGTAYNFGSTEISSGAGSPRAKVSLTGVAATDIDLTARSLIRVINRYAGNTTVYAYYLTGPSDLPGQMLIEEKGIGASAFTLQSSHSSLSSMFFPEAPVSPATTTKCTSTNTIQKNGLYYCKYQEFEHVPLLNYLLIGPANKEILRIAALKDSLIVIKEEAVYRVSGDSASTFQSTMLDNTVFCKSVDSVRVLANQVIMLSNQGVVSISDTGVSVISRDIEPDLLPLLQDSSLSSKTYAIAYDSEKSYILSTITASGDSAQNQTFIYNVFTRTWMGPWSFGISGGIAEQSADKLYFSKPSEAKVYRERKAFSDADYYDPETSITITSISGRNVTFTISGSTPEVGWEISQGGSGLHIEKLTTGAGDFTAYMDGEIPSAWATGAATAYPSVGFEIEWNAWTANAPGHLKQAQELAILTDHLPTNNTATAVVATFKSNFDEEEEEVTITQEGAGWGSGGWGAIPWGSGGDSYGYRTYVPMNKQYCSRLMPGMKLKNAGQKVSIAGFTVKHEMIGEEVGR